MTSTKTTWDSDADILEGEEPIDKAELIGVPFLITRVDFSHTERYSKAEVFAQTEDGKEFYFVDGSTGVRVQLIKYIEDRFAVAVDEEAGSYDMRLLIFKGLRVSKYLRDNGAPAQTYYLRAGR